MNDMSKTDSRHGESDDECRLKQAHVQVGGGRVEGVGDKGAELFRGPRDDAPIDVVEKIQEKQKGECYLVGPPGLCRAQTRVP